MFNAFIRYCIDGYSTIEIKVDSLREQLQRITNETSGIFSSPFSVDVVIKEIGIIGVGLAPNTVLCYKSSDLQTQLTALGDINSEGNTSFYFGDYSLISNKYLIPYDLALDIINDWIKTGILSDRVIWTDALY